MGNHSKVEFTTHGDASTVIAALRDFLRSSGEWRLMEKESAEYANGIGGDAIMVLATPQGIPSGIAIAIASMDDKTGMRLVNIIPERGEISVEDYNRIARHFVRCFRAFARRKMPGIVARVHVMRTPTTLEEIIPGSLTRRLFEQFLLPGATWGTPTITHPNDIERLDRFICALHRWRSSCHFPAMKQWLIAEKHWPKDDADWLCDRIETGLQILQVSMQFH